MTILGIDTCDKTAAAAIMTDGKVTAETAFVTGRTHSQVILPLAKRCLQDVGLSLSDMDVFAAVSGPGSYTGLRIGIAAVQGICYALDKPCVGVSALECLAYGVSAFEGTVCAVMHARQRLMYNAFFSVSGRQVHRLSADCITDADELVRAMGAYDDVMVTGDVSLLDLGGIRCAPELLRRRSAASLCAAAMQHEPVTADRLLPDYLQITKAEKDLLG